MNALHARLMNVTVIGLCALASETFSLTGCSTHPARIAVSSAAIETSSGPSEKHPDVSLVDLWEVESQSCCLAPALNYVRKLLCGLRHTQDFEVCSATPFTHYVCMCCFAFRALTAILVSVVRAVLDVTLVKVFVCLCDVAAITQQLTLR